MTFRGSIQNGGVVFEGSVPLPEGTVVKVEPEILPAAESTSDPIYRIYELAAPTGIPDLSLNLDHYLYGLPKVTDDAQRCGVLCPIRMPFLLAKKPFLHQLLISTMLHHR